MDCSFETLSNQIIKKKKKNQLRERERENLLAVIWSNTFGSFSSEFICGAWNCFDLHSGEFAETIPKRLVVISAKASDGERVCAIKISRVKFKKKKIPH